MAVHSSDSGTEKGTGKRDAAWIRAVDAISEASGYVSGLSIVASTLIICYAIMVRARGGTTIWQTELAVYLLMVVTFVGGAYGLKHGHHVRVDALVDRLPVRVRAVVEIVAATLALVIIAAVTWRAGEMWWHATERGWTSGTAWNPPLVYPYAILPLGMALITLQYLVLIARMVRTLTGARPTDGDETVGDGVHGDATAATADGEEGGTRS